MAKRHIVTLPGIITVYNGMFDYMDGVMHALAHKQTKWNKDLYFAVKFVRQKLSKCYTEVTSTTGMLLIVAHILQLFWKLVLFKKWHQGMDINPGNNTYSIAQFKEAYLYYVENEYFAEHRRVLVINLKNFPNNNLVSFAILHESGQCSCDIYNLSCDNEEYQIPNNVGAKTPRQNDRAVRALQGTRIYLTSPPELPWD